MNIDNNGLFNPVGAVSASHVVGAADAAVVPSTKGFVSHGGAALVSFVCAAVGALLGVTTAISAANTPPKPTPPLTSGACFEKRFEDCMDDCYGEQTHCRERCSDLVVVECARIVDTP
jgi:hypothetical protein